MENFDLYTDDISLGDYSFDDSSGDSSDYIDFGDTSDDYYDDSWLFTDEFDVGGVDTFVNEYGEDGWGTFDPEESMGIGDYAPQSSGDPWADLYRDKWEYEKQQNQAEADKPWWDKALESKDTWKFFQGLLGAGLGAYQSQKNQDRQDEQSERNFEREKEMLQFKNDLYNNRPARGGGGGAAPAPTSGYEYKPGITTGKFSKK